MVGGGEVVAGLHLGLSTTWQSPEKIRQSCKGETESGLSVLVFCAILKTNKINIT